MNRLDINANPAQIARLLAAARQNAERLAAIDDSDRATLSRGLPDSPTSGAISIPGYQMVCEIHRGGQGVVYQAIRESTGQDVAIKVLHDRRAASPRELERFEREAAVLRDLNHPNLIAISEVGVVEGRPYLVMPYISGWPLDEHVRRNSLSVSDTMALFLKVCDAVNVAHLNGVIHRDIKPSNIRVDDACEPHVLDFGLAKAVASSPGESLTETGQFVGSMPWASPEQADPSFGRVDVRTDVYSLGAVLYQLLTGKLPIDPIGSQREVLNRIVTAEPTSLRSHRAEINDEVETIVLKCLSKDRARRYSNADGLAADVRRYLAGEAIEAKRDSITYMARKLIRKHRGLVGAIGLVLLVGAVGGATSFFLWQKARHESQQAADARDAESDQRARAEAINAFLKEMLTAADPAKAKGAKLTVREALDEAAKRIDSTDLSAQPLVEADIRATIGSTYFALGLYPQALAHLSAAEAIQTREVGDEHIDVLRIRSRLAQSYAWAGDHERAVALARPTVERQRRVLGSDHPETLRTLSFLGNALMICLENPDESEQCLREALVGQTRVLGREHEDTIETMVYLSWALDERSDESLTLAQEALEISTRILGPDHPQTCYAMLILGMAYGNGGQIAEAEVWRRRALEATVRVFGEEHHRTADCLADLGMNLFQLDRHAEGEEMHRRAMEIARRTYGPGNKWTLRYTVGVANILRDTNRIAEAAEMLGHALDEGRRILGDEDFETLNIRIHYANALSRLGRNAEAAEHTAQGFEVALRKAGPAHKWTRDFGRSHANNLWELGRRDEAIALLHKNLAACRDARGPRARQTLQELERCAVFLHGRGMAVEAQPLAREAVDGYRSVEPKFRRFLGNPFHTLALILAQLDRPQEALELAVEGARVPNANAVHLNFAARQLLTTPMEELRNPTLALEFVIKCNELSHHEKPDYLDTLALAYHRTGQTAKAIEMQKKAISLLAADAPNRADYEKSLREFERAIYPHGMQDNK